MELATSSSVCQSGGLTLGSIAAVFTINYVAEMLGEDEDGLYELSIDMFAEDGYLHVYGVGEDGVTAFTEYPETNHCRREGGRKGPTHEIVSLRYSPDGIAQAKGLAEYLSHCGCVETRATRHGFVQLPV